MSDDIIPFELQREILLRLPAEPLLRLRAVCKSWRHMIDDPSFARSHFNNNQRFVPNLLIRSESDYGTLYSLSLDSLNHISGDQTIDATRVNLVRRAAAHIPAFPLSTSNGLILIHNLYNPNRYNAGKIWVIWNPLTGDSYELPQLNLRGCDSYQPPQQLDIELNLRGCGIGYDSASDDYKVVRIDKVRTDHSFLNGEGEGGCRSVYRTLVYSLRLNTWKMILDCPSEICDSRVEGVFLNGALHWIAKDRIVVLDLATEEYRQVLMPPDLLFPLDTSLGAFDGCLVLSAGATKQAWMMKDDGVESKWVELFSSVEQHAIGVVIGVSSSGWVWPIAYSKSKRQLILQHEEEIIVWDIEKCSANKVTIHGLQRPLSSQICQGSIFRFNGIDGIVKRKMNKATTRLKLSVTTTTYLPCLLDSEGSSSEAGELED